MTVGEIATPLTWGMIQIEAQPRVPTPSMTCASSRIHLYSQLEKWRQDQRALAQFTARRRVSDRSGSDAHPVAATI
jgi:hypothetical protein